MVNIIHWLRKATKTDPREESQFIPRPHGIIPFDDTLPRVANYKLKRKATLVLRKEEVSELAGLLDFVLCNTQETEVLHAAERFHKMLRPRIRVKTLTERKPRKIPKQFTRKKV